MAARDVGKLKIGGSPHRPLPQQRRGLYRRRPWSSTRRSSQARSALKAPAARPGSRWWGVPLSSQDLRAGRTGQRSLDGHGGSARPFHACRERPCRGRQSSPAGYRQRSRQGSPAPDAPGPRLPAPRTTRPRPQPSWSSAAKTPVPRCRENSGAAATNTLCTS